MFCNLCWARKYMIFFCDTYISLHWPLLFMWVVFCTSLLLLLLPSSGSKSNSDFFFVDTTVFCATQHFFVLPNVSIKNMWIKRNRCEAIKKIWKPHAVLHLMARFSSFGEIKREYCLKGWEHSKNNAQTQFPVPEFLWLV